jgi:hypothetical protein
VDAGPAVFDAVDNRAGAEKHAIRHGLSGAPVYPQNRTPQQAATVPVIIRPAAEAPRRTVQSAAQTDVTGIHVGGTTGQQGDQRQALERRILQQVGENPGYSAIATVNGQHIYGTFRQHGQRCRYVGCIRCRAMENPWVICDNAFNGPQVFSVVPAVGVADKSNKPSTPAGGFSTVGFWRS